MEIYFKNNLKYLRSCKGLSQSNLAQKIGKDQSTIAYWENGKAEPTLENIVKTADVLQISIENFIGKDLAKENDNFNELNNLLYSKIKKLTVDEKKAILQVIEIIHKDGDKKLDK